MKKFQFFKLAALLFIPSLCSAGTMTSMSQDEVKTTFSDKTISTISTATLNGALLMDSFTGYFSKDGTMQGSFSKKPDNAPQTDSGTWKVNADGAFCYQWQNWDNNKEKCVTFYKLNNSILVINDKNGFETLILNKDIVSGNRLPKTQP